MSDKHISINVVFDPGCPWCLVGGKRMDKAIEQAKKQGLSFSVKWLPFMLSPDASTEGKPSREHMINIMGEQGYAAARERLRPIGEEIGIEWAADKGKGVIASTLRSLCLIEWAWQQGLKTSIDEAQRLQKAVVYGVFDICFVEGENVSDSKRLRSVAQAAGLDADAAEADFMSDSSQQAIRESIATSPYMQASGGRGVPLFVFNDRLMMTGAQEAATFLEAFDQALAQSE